MWFKKKLPENEQLKAAIKILFPDYRSEVLQNGEIISIDESIDENLHVVLADLEMGINDDTSRKTLSTAVKRLQKLRDILDIHQTINPDAKVIVYDLVNIESEVIAHEI